MITKVCLKCGEEKTIDNFYRSRKNEDGFSIWCIACHYIAQTGRRKENVLLSYVTQLVKSSKTRQGITREEYRSILKSQNGVCAICKQPETIKGKGGSIRSLSVNYCHETGEVKGLLCLKCSIILDQCNNNIEILENAIAYLRK